MLALIFSALAIKSLNIGQSADDVATAAADADRRLKSRELQVVNAAPASVGAAAQVGKHRNVVVSDGGGESHGKRGGK